MNVPLRILRLQNVYGAGQALENSYTGVLTYFARQAIAGEPIDVYEGGGILRDFVHVDDVVSALKAALALPANKPFGLVDIGSGSAGSLFDYASMLAETAGSPAPKTSSRFRLGDVRAAYADIEPAQELLGYQPEVSFRDGVVGLLEWARQGSKN